MGDAGDTHAELRAKQLSQASAMGGVKVTKVASRQALKLTLDGRVVLHRVDPRTGYVLFPYLVDPLLTMMACPARVRRALTPKSKVDNMGARR